ncbi:MAG: D-alanine--D-alanine ligase, partial [Cyclobacteriaceae bacterium]|nr:D-alanine--D-alanine ligase [Cyclobacteriaceae bacterium]
PQGSWYFLNEYRTVISEGESLGISLSQRNDPFFILENQRSIGKIDVVFPILHGTDGEDGSIQGLLRTLNIPVVGSGVLGSSIAFDKLCSKKLLFQANIPSAKYVALPVSEKGKVSFEEIRDQLGVPFFIKPVSSGSSVGVFKIRGKEDFNQALEDAFQYDNTLLVEEFVDGREIECAVMGNDPVEASLPGEIRVVGNHDFYSFDAKYVDDAGAQLDMPAKLPEETVKRVQELAKRAFKSLSCEDYSRVDMFLKKNGEIFINEINTIPGFTHISMFPQLWTLTGMTYTELITRLISYALEKHKGSMRIKRDYESAL